MEVGPPVDGGPATAPPAEPLEGRFVRLEPTTASHAGGLYARSHRSPEDAGIWTYMPYGPFADADEMAGWVATCVGSTDPMFFTVVERGSRDPVGMASLLNIDPRMRHLE